MKAPPDDLAVRIREAMNENTAAMSSLEKTRAVIGEHLDHCNHDELRVVCSILARLELGRARYGLLDLDEPRDWQRELGEELLDAVVYAACVRLTKAGKP